MITLDPPLSKPFKSTLCNDKMEFNVLLFNHLHQVSQSLAQRKGQLDAKQLAVIAVHIGEHRFDVWKTCISCASLQADLAYDGILDLIINRMLSFAILHNEGWDEFGVWFRRLYTYI